MRPTIDPARSNRFAGSSWSPRAAPVTLHEARAGATSPQLPLRALFFFARSFANSSLHECKTDAFLSGKLQPCVGARPVGSPRRPPSALGGGCRVKATHRKWFVVWSHWFPRWPAAPIRTLALRFRISNSRAIVHRALRYSEPQRCASGTTVVICATALARSRRKW